MFSDIAVVVFLIVSIVDLAFCDICYKVEVIALSLIDA
ncbi:Uncharacterised protein [Mycobacterium tuberculosis]|nr:Uncharacterised protein [Mycobacterium tuberculosis]